MSDFEFIGESWPINEQRVPEEGLIFTIPYGKEDEGYNILLRDNEMDKLLRSSFERMLANQLSTGFDYRVNLSRKQTGRGTDLPLFIGSRSISISDGVEMQVNVATQSVVYEHRGILQARRESWDGKWSLLDYIIRPPLSQS